MAGLCQSSEGPGTLPRTLLVYSLSSPLSPVGQVALLHDSYSLGKLRLGRGGGATHMDCT